MPLWYESDLARIWFSAQALTVGLLRPKSLMGAGTTGSNPTLRQLELLRF